MIPREVTLDQDFCFLMGIENRKNGMKNMRARNRNWKKNMLINQNKEGKKIKAINQYLTKSNKEKKKKNEIWIISVEN